VYLSLQDLADDYAHRIRTARNPRREAERVLAELNGIPQLTRADRLEVFDLVCDQLGLSDAARPHIYRPQPWSGDNARTMDLIRAIRGLIK
jgi:hypothetical protein